MTTHNGTTTTKLSGAQHQRSLLPRKLVSVPGVTIAARYLPARDEVGGDWYDTIELPSGQVGIAIGDVVGHGLAAASLMGQLRTALRSYALNGNGPARTLELVDRFAWSLDEEAMATAAYAVVDTDGCVVRLASAGHLPPVVVSAAGKAYVAQIAPAPPIGAFSFKSCPEHELRLKPGDTLLLYTDGLIERPSIPLGRSIELLADTLRDAVGAEHACLVAMDQFVPALGTRDHVAVIAAQIDAAPEVLDLELPALPSTLARLRPMLAHWLRAQDVEREVATEIMIAVSEACTNAIEHAYSPRQGTIKAHAERAVAWIEVTVSDHGRWRPPRGEHRGRGLPIIRAAMDSLEIRKEDHGTEILMRRTLRSA
jgi:anti-sigma regulatory factor (Ser/Thr protein kinase)